MLFCACFLQAQHYENITPGSFARDLSLASFDKIPVVRTVSPDISKAIAEDALSDQDRFALPVDVNIDPQSNGLWEQGSHNEMIWRVRLSQENAKGWILCFSELALERGAKLFMYTPNHQVVKGAFTFQNNNEAKKLTVGPIPGDEIVIELNIPSQAKRGDISAFKLEKAYFVYKSNPNVPGVQTVLGDAAYNSSFPCMINVNCPEGSKVIKQKDGVVRILLAGDKGFYYCTGSLMNNTKKDSTPYVLSGFHCEHDFVPSYDNYIFAFGWETPSCQMPTNEPSYLTMDGCSMMARREQSDFVLYKLKTKIPFNFPAYFNGWDKSDTKIPTSTSMVHHPNGDVKKVSLDGSPSVIWKKDINWNNGIITPAYEHWRVSLTKGASMPGSSGAPLFDERGLVVGQLNGGNSACNYSTLYYGRFSKSWDEGTTPSTRLKEWLDPLGLGKDTIQGLSLASSAAATIAGRITNSKSLPIKNVMVVISGFVKDTFITGADGKYKFDNIAVGHSYTITPYYNTFPLDGISAGDLVIINKHILGFIPITSEFKKLAADINKSNTITAGDLSILTSMILGKLYEFPNAKNWYFVTPDFKYPNLAGSVDRIQIANLSIDLFDQDFIAVKLGDLSGTK